MLKQVKDFILKFTNLYTMIFVSFPSGVCVDKVVENWSNYEGCKYVYLQIFVTHRQSSISWMVKEFVRLSEELLSISRVVWTTVDDVNVTKLKIWKKKFKAMKKKQIKDNFTLGPLFYK